MMKLGELAARKIAGTKSLARARALCYILQIGSESPVRIRYGGMDVGKFANIPLYRVSRFHAWMFRSTKRFRVSLGAHTIVSAINPILCPSLQITDRVLIDLAKHALCVSHTPVCVRGI